MGSVTVATIKLYGGHPALDFTNTVNARGPEFGPDVLVEFRDLLDWGVRVGIIDTKLAAALRDVAPQRAEATLCQAKTLREAIYRIFSAQPRSAASEADLDVLQRQVSLGQGRRVLVPEAGGYAWRWLPGDPDTITNRIALAAADLLTSALSSRVRVCPGENCGWLFLDASRPGRRVWCSEETCGTRNRVRRWRSRQHSG